MNRTPAYSFLLTAMLILTLAGSAMARQLRIELADGRRITGDLVTETDEQITLRISGNLATFNKVDVVGQQVILTLTEQFRVRQSGIKNDEHDKRYELARWASSHRTPEGWRLAKDELDELIADAPDHQHAKLLHSVVVERLRVEAAKEKNRDKPKPGGPVDPKDPQTDPEDEEEDDEFPLITREEANIIKVMEIDLGKRPSVRVSKEAVEALFENYRNSPAMERFLDRGGKTRFAAMPDYAQLEVIFEVGARELYSEVLVKDEPAHLKEFRSRINSRYLIKRCGQCHGPGQDTGFVVFTQKPRREASAYSNFMVLHLAKSQGRRLIDRDRQDKEKSLLIQYGMRRDEATFPHPKVPGFPAALRGKKDPMYRELVRWINKLWTPTPSYPIKYRPRGIKLPTDKDKTGKDTTGKDPPKGDKPVPDEPEASGDAGGPAPSATDDPPTKREAEADGT